jgi:hypothetical protein
MQPEFLLVELERVAIISKEKAVFDQDDTIRIQSKPGV